MGCACRVVLSCGSRTVFQDSLGGAEMIRCGGLPGTEGTPRMGEVPGKPGRVCHPRIVETRKLPAYPPTRISCHQLERPAAPPDRWDSGERPCWVQWMLWSHGGDSRNAPPPLGEAFCQVGSRPGTWGPKHQDGDSLFVKCSVLPCPSSSPCLLEGSCH